ncbi:carbohydrate ABC transporter substrate-binding protein (CUT1 family) [Roseibium hamelinense]|uniref:sn-glycerol-3-phosphate-binding periplasmic protein UgpB n=1 Tax=Roseibium hamelinense TaxID=150831 RepID=A0A562T114_9HYPH|nr:extracellular solute-binding protein [Roseibium hamelinense]MTI44547.1 extracellular solute-binding protein [Roseibium hamelinense]TWI87172.1 carbohydrate ABC transporter substrate-binding protein (CUT1 family) [Roseibium hamelinense]
MAYHKTVASVVAAAAMLGTSTVAFAATEISWWHAMGGRLGEVVVDIANGYNESQTACSITPVYKGTYEETLTAGIAAFRAGEQPNVIQVFDAGAATIISAKGAVIPAQDILQDAGVEFDINDYIEGVRNFYADSDGKMIGMPFNSSTPILYINEEALEKAGVEAPETWEQFQEVAPKLKEAGYVPLAQSHLPWIFTENFKSRHNLQFATNNNGYDGVAGTELVFGEPIKAHFTAVKQWLDDGLFGWYGTGWSDNQTPFNEGKVAMWLGSSGSFGGIQQTVEFPFSATYLPYWGSVEGAGTGTFIGGAALFAMSGKPDEENKCVASFFEYLTSPEVQYMWHKETGYVPITNAAYELAKEDGYYESTPAAEIGIKQLSLPGGDWTKGYRMGFYVQIRDVMNREYGKMLTGETSVEEGFATIEAEGNKLLERFAKTTEN